MGDSDNRTQPSQHQGWAEQGGVGHQDVHHSAGDPHSLPWMVGTFLPSVLRLREKEKVGIKLGSEGV
jgi:hypothetical protein